MVNKSYIVIGVLIATFILALTLGLTLWPVNIEKEVMKRCTTNWKKLNMSSQDDCEKILTSFTQAFVGRDPDKEVPPGAYDSLISTVSQVSKKPACNKRVFWSGTKKTARDYADKCFYLTQAHTLPAFLLDDLYWCGKVKWCGKKESQEISTRGCPDGPYDSFWDRSSAAFAASACGDAFVMLDGSQKDPYYSNSIFARVEVQRLKMNRAMNSLTVLLVNGDKKTCDDNESLKRLQSELGSNLRYNCKPSDMQC